MKIRGLWKVPHMRGWLWSTLGLAVVGRAMLSKSLIQFSADGWVCVLRPDYGRINGDLLLKDLCQHAVTPRTVVVMPLTPWHSTVDSHLCRRLLDTHRQVGLSLLWGHCSFLLGLGAHKVLLCPPRVCFMGDSQSFYRIPRLGNRL